MMQGDVGLMIVITLLPLTFEAKYKCKRIEKEKDVTYALTIGLNAVCIITYRLKIFRAKKRRKKTPGSVGYSNKTYQT